MEYKQIFDYEGTPYLVKTDEEGFVSQEELDRVNITEYTDIMPPSHLFPPRYFDGKKWFGKSEEEWELENPTEPVMPSEVDILNAQLIANNLENSAKIDELQNDILNLTLKLLEFEGGIANVPNT
ncbi:hypothetical protein V5G65_03710 [Mammaliicoccus sciuri]|uniref:hypothetical protein n=1 Tax=Mammaliicoccus sciuri TaxID=1296 RepID=UPI0037B38B8F